MQSFSIGLEINLEKTGRKKLKKSDRAQEGYETDKTKILEESRADRYGDKNPGERQRVKIIKYVVLGIEGNIWGQT
jgi:hypothetical protein